MGNENGLTDSEINRIEDLIIDISRVIIKIETLGRHRSYSLAVTKLDEARHWLADRKDRPA
jgi:hypothetical protein